MRILCMKIKKCFWCCDNQDPVNLYPPMHDCTHAMPLTTHPYQNFSRTTNWHMFERKGFRYGVSGRGWFPCVYSMQYLFTGITTALSPGSLRWNTASKAVTYSTQSTQDCRFPYNPSRIFKNHYLGDPKNQQEILCMKIKKYIWCSDIIDCFFQKKDRFDRAVKVHL